jgi:carboxymethylenebutenolidase
MSNTNPADRPVLAATAGAQHTVINTDASGLQTSRFAIDNAGFAVPAYAARPAIDQEGGFPVVVLLGESFGLHPYLEDVCRRFAKQGYLSVAPDLMARQGNPADYDDVERLVRDLLQRVGDLQVMADIGATIDWACANGGDSERIGINGFSWGGRWAWLYASQSDRPAAVVSWYGVLDDQYSHLLPDRTLFPEHPIDRVEKLRVPILGIYGELDTVIPLQSVHAMQERLADRADPTPDAEIDIYPHAPHGFHADWREDYDAEAAAAAWERCLGWFRAHGV